MALYDSVPAAKLLKAHKALVYPYAFSFGGADLAITEGVFCPTLTNTSPLLLSCLDLPSTGLVLDLFSGCGAFGIIAALRGCRVVTVDTSHAAVSCTRRNAIRNGVSQLVDARTGDLAEAVKPDEFFDIVIANPPLLPGKPATELEAALYDPALGATISLLSRLAQLLNEQGRSYLLLSDIFEREGNGLSAICSAHGLYARIINQRDVGYEVYSVFEITHRNRENGPS